MTKRKSLPVFLNECAAMHGSTYDYSLVNYSSAHSKIDIICRTHGIFQQRANDHVRGKGCGRCADEVRRYTTRISKLKTQEQYISDCKRVHGDRYDYSKVNYLGSGTKVEIICSTHNSFLQTASSHLEGRGCPRCGLSSVSNKEFKWLDDMGVDISNRQIKIKCDDKTYIVDGYDADTNIIYEFNGDFWHGNPHKFRQSVKHPMMNGSYGDVYNKTLHKEHALRESGFTLCVMWESDDVPVYSKRIRLN